MDKSDGETSLVADQETTEHDRQDNSSLKTESNSNHGTPSFAKSSQWLSTGFCPYLTIEQWLLCILQSSVFWMDYFYSYAVPVPLGILAKMEKAEN